ncbi:PfkB family carbohydrate kinase [Chelatococcus reniformis]|uniref:Ribokinase n=1 Tax=Chelatococcus reniformis TaxID=1494448 RepID=A0A916XHD7_9HYPH|nr:PfkB family carbohydrate kinase [Chelatococcus reniformis]GGC73455.1 ribokinase [Chelatococcus reniformis]
MKAGRGRPFAPRPVGREGAAAGVLCVGITTLDFVYALDELPTVAEKHRARDLVIASGGVAANAAVAIARLGGHAVLASRLGDDATAVEILDALHAEDVDCGYVRGFPGARSPVSTILVDRRGERLLVSYRDDRYPADPSWLPDELPEGIDAVLGDTRWEDAAVKLFAAARRAGKPAVLDGDRAPRHPEIVDLATHVAFSEQGLREFTGTADPQAGLASLRGREGTWFAVTVGADGVFFLEDGKIAHAPAFSVDAVDTLAAGDVWHGAFALALAERQSERQAIRFASAASAIKCLTFGGHKGAPRRGQLEDFLTSAAGV